MPPLSSCLTIKSLIIHSSTIYNLLAVPAFLAPEEVAVAVLVAVFVPYPDFVLVPFINF
jgi:hypothetical protein